MNKKPEYCPDWFDIKNYEPCNRFNRAAWVHALIPRIFIHNNCSRREVSDDDIEYFSQIIRQCSTYEGLNSCNELGINYDPKDDTDSSIRDLTLYDFCCVYVKVLEQHPKLVPYMNECIENAANLNQEDKSRDYEWVNMFQEEDIDLDELAPVPLYDELNPYIDIDLRANDEKILEDFQEWLNQKRITQRQSKSDYKRVTDGDIKSFNEYRVLAYIDLFLWGKLSGVPLTQPQIGNLLFPEEYNINLTERVRRSVIPHANRLMKFWFRALE